jgi:hypothetical protein
VVPEKKFRKRWNFFSSGAFCGDETQQAARVMSDETRKKQEMTISHHEIKPGSMPPNASISRKLREFYDAVQEEGIPDRFMDLLEKLDEAERSSNSVKVK